MNYTIEILNENALKLLISLEEMHLIRFIKKETNSKKEKLPPQKNFIGIISKEEGNSLREQLKEMRDEWERI